MLYYIITISSIILIPLTFIKYKKYQIKEDLQISEYHDLWDDLWDDD